MERIPFPKERKGKIHEVEREHLDELDNGSELVVRDRFTGKVTTIPLDAIFQDDYRYQVVKQ